MKHKKLNSLISIVIIACLMVTSTPLQAIAEEIGEDLQWQEILTTFEGNQHENSLENTGATSDTVKEAAKNNLQNESQFTLEAADKEYKTDRFIVKYKDNVKIENIVDIPDLSSDIQRNKSFEIIFDGLEQNDIGQRQKKTSDESEMADQIWKSMPVEINASQLDLDQASIESAKVIESENIMILNTKDTMSGIEFKDAMETKELGQDIEYIQPDYELGMSAVDPYREEQWGHYQIYDPSTKKDNFEPMVPKETIDETPYRMDANVMEAWEKSKGEGAVVALLDTGIETTHMDLQDNLLDGWDFVNNDDSVNDSDWKYDQWHGTHIAGIIAAKADNNVGVAGVAPEAKILPLKVFQGGTAYTSDIISAIKYAELSGAKIANCSWGSLYENPALEEAINSSNMIFVCAVGNGLYNTDKYPVYPASYDLNNVISVTSIDQDGRLSRFANYGKETVDIAAPGREIYSTTIDNGFTENSGTSMSAGYVSGALALLLSKDPTRTASELKTRLVSSGDIVTGLKDKVKEGRKLNCGYALSINPIPNFSSILVGDNEQLPEISPIGETEETYNPYADNHISIKTPMPTARYGLGVIDAGNKIYAIGGQDPNGYSKKVEEYDPKTDTWTVKADLPIASSYFGIAQTGGEIYVLGGYNGSYLNVVQVYNPVLNTWTIKPATHNMPISMKSFAATAYNDKIYLTGGYNGSYRNTIYEYTPSTGAWVQKQSLSYNRGEHVAIEYDGKIYIDGGCTTGGRWFNAEEVYDIKTSQVQQTGTSRMSTMNGAAIHQEDQFVLIGGKSADTGIFYNGIFQKCVFDPNDTFVTANSMYLARAGLGAAVVNGKVYIMGGFNSAGIIATVEELDLGWEVKGSLPIEMRNFTSIECNGKLYTFGGEALISGQNERIKSVYEYNQESNSWIQKMDMPAYLDYFSVAEAYGKIYIIGGKTSNTATGNSTADNKVYEFNPVINKWTEKARFSSPRYNMSATFFSGHVYIAGGQNSAGNSVADVEVYDLRSDTWQKKKNLPQSIWGYSLTVLDDEIYLVGEDVLVYDDEKDVWHEKYKGLGWMTFSDSNCIITLYGNVYSFVNLGFIQNYKPTISKYDFKTNQVGFYFTYPLLGRAVSVVSLNNRVYAFGRTSQYASKLIEYRPPASPWLNYDNSGLLSRHMGIGVIESNIYHVGGEFYNGNSTNVAPSSRVLVLNTQTNAWNSVANMNYARSNLAVGTINGKLYAAGGSSSGVVAYLEEYDPVSNRWSNKAGMPRALKDMACAVSNGKLYLFGGTNGGSVYNTTYIYDPQTNAWTTGADMPTVRYACGATVLSDGKVYIVGGFDRNNAPLKKVEAYDPMTNTWTTKRDLPMALGYGGVTGIDSAYVVGGTDGIITNSLVYEYSPITDKWFSWPGPSLALYGSGVAIANNGIYVINGRDMLDVTYSHVRYLPLGGSYNADYIHLGEESVNLSGNLARNYTDMGYTSQGFQINFSRTYNTRDDSKEGNLISKGWTFGFQGKVSSAGNDTLVRLPNGSGYSFKENIDGSYVAKDSRSTLVKQADGSHVMVTKDLYSYGFNSSGYLAWMKDRNGNMITITVDSSGKITQIVDPVGRQTNITYSSDKIWRITDFAGRVVEYSYNTGGSLSAVTDPMGNVTRYSYDSNGFLTEVNDHNGNLIERFSYYNIPSYETLPRLKTVTDALGKEETYQYNENEGWVTITDNNGRQNITWYDQMLYPVKIRDAENKEQRIEYNLTEGINKYGEEKSIINRRGNATYYDRDAGGNIIRQINPNGSVREFSYDNKNNLISEKDELGKCTFYVYDSNKINLLKTARPLSGTDIYSDAAPQANFAITTNTYYTAAEAQTMCGKAIGGLLKTVVDPNGGMTTYTYDSNGNIAAVKNTLNQTAAYQYNPLGWLKQETSVKGYLTKYYYDRNGNIVKKVGHGGETERTVVDYRGRIIQNIRPNQYDAASDTASAYNSDNLLINTNTYGAVGAGYRYAYFASGLLQKETDPLNYEMSYTYDQYGNVLTKAYPNGYTELSAYDVLNRIVSESYKESSISPAVITNAYSYQITGQGHLERTHTHYFNSASAPESAVSKETYDYADRLIRTDNADGGYSINEYAANGTLSITTDPMGYKTYYLYDGLNRETGKWSEVSSGVCSYEGKEYDKNGNVLKIKISGNTAAPYSAPSGGTRYDSFLYDGIGRTIEEGDSQGGRTTYDYADATDTVTQRQYTSSQSVETVSLFNYFGKIKENNLKVNSADMSNSISNLKTSYTFDKEGNILTEKRPDDVAVTYTYDLLGRKLTSSEPGTNEDGRATTLTRAYTYDFRGNVLTETDPLGRVTDYTYSPSGLLQKKTDAKGGTTYTLRAPDDLLVAEISPQNYVEGAAIDQMNRKTYQYDSMGRAMKENSIYKDSTGTFRTIAEEYTYDKNGNRLTSRDGMGYVTTYTYDGKNRQLTVLDPDAKDRGLSFTKKYTYDGLGQVTAIENGVNAVISYTYNDQGKVLTEAVDGMVTKTCTYDLTGNLLSEKDGNGNTTSYTYNALGKIRTQTFPGDDSIPSHTASCQYTATGDLSRVSDTLNKVSLYTYDNQHHLLSEIEMRNGGADAITKSYRYDLAGNMRFSVDGRGNVTEITYDALNQKISQKAPVTVNGALTVQTTGYAYDADGKQIGITDWLGNQYVNIYDGLGRLTAKKDPYGNLIEALSYDSNHRQISSADALNNTITFDYDKANRLIAKTDASGNTEGKTYDAVGNILSTIDGSGNVTHYQYDANNRLISVVNALQQETSYTYDAAGNLLNQTDGKGNVTTYQYNVRNLPVTRIDAGGIVSGTVDSAMAETYRYNSDGKLSVKTDRNGIATAYVYDIHGRLISEDAGGDLVSYTYDGDNNQLTMADSTGITTRVYDELSRVISKTVPRIGTTNFLYDQTTGFPAGYVNESYQDPQENVVVKTKDKAGRLYQVKTGSNVTTYAYYANGNLQKLEYPNGVSEEYTYYANNKLYTLVNRQGGSIVEAFSYEYDEAGNLTGKADRKGITSYTYDKLNRLLTVIEPEGKTTEYEYDAAGNRIGETVATGNDLSRTEYEYNGQNRLISTLAIKNSVETGGSENTYDNNGNLLSVLPYTLTDAATPSAMTVELSILGDAGNQNNKGVSLYEYDNRNQMMKAIGEGYTVESEYNGEGLRVAKTVNGETSNFLYEYDKIILETDGNNTEIAQNIYGANLISRNSGGDSLYYLYNGHGDVTGLVNPSGTLEAEYYYDSFGTVTEETGTADNPFRYAGYEYDSETTLYYLKSRMYDSITARFLQEDTYRGQANDPLSLNLYTYCNNNPLIYWDPDGHVVTAWDKKNLSSSQIKTIEKATAAYNSAAAKGDKAGMATAHAAAEAARNTSRSSNEVGSASGYTYTVSKSGSASLNKYDSEALEKSKSSGSTSSGGGAVIVLNGSSYLPEVSSSVEKIIIQNFNSMVPAFMSVKSTSSVQGSSNLSQGLTPIWRSELYGSSAYDPRIVYDVNPYRSGTAYADPKILQDNLDKLVKDFIAAYKAHQTSENLLYDEVNYWTLGLPDAWSRNWNSEPLSLENWVASAELLLYFIPESKATTLERNTLKRELTNIIDDIGKGAGKVIDDLPSGWTKTTNNGFTHIKDVNGNIRVRIDPPDAKTPYPHKHLYDEAGNSLDINGNIVSPKSPDAHIPLK